MVAPQGASNNLTTTVLLLAAPFSGAVLLALFHLLTRERVNIFFQAQLVVRNVFMQLIPNLFLDRRFVFSHGVNVVSSAPEMPVPIFVFQVGLSVKDHETALALEISHERCDTQVRRNLDQHVDVIWAAFGFHNPHTFPLTQFSENLSDISFDFSVNYLSAVLRRKDYVILAPPFTVR